MAFKSDLSITMTGWESEFSRDLRYCSRHILITWVSGLYHVMF